MHFLMLSCDRVTELTEKGKLTGLGIGQLVQLFLHRQMCSGCRLYEKQSIWIDRVMVHKSAKSATNNHSKLPDSSKKAIQDKISHS